MKKKPDIQAFIFARGGSKGVPGKNIKPLAGKPLIAYAIESALNAPSLGSVIVSTDCEHIARVAREYGAEVPFMRPSELAQDTSPELLAWKHAIQWVEQTGRSLDYIVSLPTTSPFRSINDIENCITLMAENDETDVVVTVKEADRSPYFNMVTKNDDQNVQLVINPKDGVNRRQDAPKVFDMTTVCYVARVDFLRSNDRLFDGCVKAVTVPAERALDIDTPYDFFVADLLAKHSS